MAIEIVKGVRYEYACDTCGHNYVEQRPADHDPYFVDCQKYGCDGTFKEVNQTEFTYEREVPDPVIEEPAVEVPTTDPASE